MSIKWRKRGTIDDKIFMLTGFTAVLMFVAIVAYTYPILWDALFDITVNQSNSSTAALNTLNPTDVVNWLDVMLVVAFFAVNVLVCIIMPMYLEFNPIYYGAVFVFGFVWIYVVAVWSNVMKDAIDSFQTLPITAFVLSNAVLMEIVFLMALTLVMFYKRRGESIA